MSVAAQEVQEKVNAVLMDLPRGIDPPSVIRFDPDSAPILFIALNAKGHDTKEITDLADRVVRRRIESTSGVGQVRITGGTKRQVNVWVDPVKLRSVGLSAAEVARAIDAQNVTVPAGASTPAATSSPCACTGASRTSTRCARSWSSRTPAHHPPRGGG